MMLSAVFKRRFHAGIQSFAGHSKWQNIKHRKARQDASRSSLNTRISNMITVAVREGGGADPSTNVRLATMVENATKQSIPKKVIEAAIARGSGAMANASGEPAVQITYEGIGPGGAAVLVVTLTANKNRTAQQVRAAFLKFKGALSPCQFMFERRGWIELNEKGSDAFDKVFEHAAAIEGVVDIEQEQEDGNESIVVHTEPSALSSVAQNLKSRFKIEDMGLAFVPLPDQTVQPDSETAERLEKLVSDLMDLEDVSEVYTNQAS